MNGYKFEDIEKLFTEKVANYLEQGYVFHDPRSLGNECIKVDLKRADKEKNIRIMLLHGNDSVFSSDYYWLDTISIVVGEYDKKSNGYYYPFNDDASVIEKTTFYTHRYDYRSDKVGYFTTDKDVAIGWFKKSDARHMARHILKKAWNTSSDEAKRAVIPFVKRQQGFKTKKESDIVSIEKVPREERTVYPRYLQTATAITPLHYYVRMKNGKCLRLGYKEIVVA